MDCHITIATSGKASKVLANNGKESQLYTSLLSVPFIENGSESIDLYGRLISLDFLKEKHIQDENGEPKLYFMAGNSNVNPLFESFANAKAAYPNSPILAGFAKHGKLQQYNGRSYAPMNQFSTIASFANILSDGNTKNDIINNLIVSGKVNGKKSWRMQLKDKVKSYIAPLEFSTKPRVEETPKRSPITRAVTQYLKSKGFPINILSEQQIIDEVRKLGYNNFNSLQDEINPGLNNAPQFLKDKSERVYGFYNPQNNQIYLTEEVLNSDTLVHELYHWWRKPLQVQANNGNKTAEALLEKFNSLADTLIGGEAKLKEYFDNASRLMNNVDFSTQNDEIQAIKAEAIANGTFMKAPNGQPTNLNEKQWLQVRTRAFKNWFGDFEAINENYLPNFADYIKLYNEKITRLEDKYEQGREESGAINKIATIITSKVHRDVQEKQGISNPNAYSKIKQLEVAELEKYAKENNLFIATPQSEKLDSGNESDVYRGENGTTVIKINDANNNNSWLEFLDSIAIHNAENPNTKYSIKGFGYNENGNFSIVVEQDIINGQPAPFEKIHQNLIDNGYELYGEYGDGSYINKDTNIILEDVKEDNVFIDANGNLYFIDTDYYVNTQQKGGKVSLEYVKLNVAENSVSKVVDANGEPLVVFHGRSKYFTEFSNRYAGKYTSDNGKLGFFFTDSFNLAKLFTKNKWSSPKSKERKGANVLEAFVNIKNPNIIGGRQFTMLGDATKYRNEQIENGNDGIIITPMTQEDLESWERIFGTDGIAEFKHLQFAVFNPNQIKSATDNNGDFSIDNNNINFSVGDNTEAINQNNLISKIKNYATKISEGREEIFRLSKEAEQGREEGGIRNVEATLLLATGGTEFGKVEGREAQQQIIEDYAKKEGIWYDNIEAKPTDGLEEKGLGIFKDSGEENNVYIPTENPLIVRKTMKTTDPFNKDNPNEVLYHLDTRISEHNAGIGATVPYTVIGFGRLSNGDFVVITEQPHIQNARLATKEEIHEEMLKMGFEEDGKDSFINENHFITDVNPKNVLVDEKGNLYFIDSLYDILYDVNEDKIDISKEGKDDNNINFSVGSSNEKAISVNGIETTIFASEVYNPRQNETFELYRDRMREEAIARLLGENSTEYFEKIAKEAGLNAKETKSFVAQVKQFILDFSNWLKQQLGVTDISPEQVAKMTNKELFDAVITSMLRGDYITSEIEKESLIVAFNIIGERGASSLNESLETMANLERAKEMLSSKKKSPKQIKDATGWEYSPKEDKWKLELDYGKIKNLPMLREMAANSSFNRKYVDNVTYKSNGDGTYDVKMYNTENTGSSEGRTIEYRALSKNSLSDILGDELSSDILSEKGTNIAEDWEMLYGEPAEKAFEISGKKYNMSVGNAMKLSDVFVSPKLFKAYPSLKDLDVVISPLKTGEAAWDGENIVLTPESALNSDKYIRSLIIHEVQHFIQEQEGFAMGGSTDDFINNKIDLYINKYEARHNELASKNYYDLSYEEKLEFVRLETYKENVIADIDKMGGEDAKYGYYQRLAGEVESRNAQRRSEMTKAKRLKTLLSETEDIKEEDKIYLYGSYSAYSEMNPLDNRQEQTKANMSENMPSMPLNLDKANEIQEIEYKIATNPKYVVDALIQGGYVEQNCSL